ncbi:MAG: hypothetical protein IKO10_12205, partial [Lachnospiraceae bacterium]|nr:hypothetical protein [Lachnospiraceae bacterium]
KTALSAPASMYTPQTFVHLTRPSGTLPSRGGQEFFATATELAKYEFVASKKARENASLEKIREM